MSPTTYTIKSLRVEAKENIILDIPLLDIQNAGFVRISGDNGAGKTTLMKALNKLISIPKNCIYYLGDDIYSDDGKMRKETVYLHQSPYPLQGKVYSNISFGLKLRSFNKDIIGEKVNEISKLLEIDHLFNKNAALLSGGELQRVALARVLVLGCKVLLLDEPTAHGDQKSKDIIISAIKEYQKKHNALIIYTSHEYQRNDFDDEAIILLKNGIIDA